MGNKSSGGPKFQSVRSDDSDSNAEAKMEKIRSAKEDFELGNVEFLRGNCESASSLYRHAIEKIHSGQQNEHEHELVVATSNLGVQTFAEGRYDAAKALLDEAIERSSKIVRRDDPVPSLSGLSIVLSRERSSHSLSPREKVLESRLKEHTSVDSVVADILNNLGCCCEMSGDLAEAAAFYEEGLKLRQVRLSYCV
jgi:tetratricopeptide (TPR) repeat protein